jgi:hypothetical protein
MVDPIERASTDRQKAALSKVRELMGSITQSRTLQDIIPGFRTQKGIYKPTDSSYALWIRQTVRGKYPDKEPDIYPDGSWSYEYMPEAKGGKTDLSLSTNRSLLNCMNDRVPIGVFIQREIPDIQRAYQVMGLAYVEDFDGTRFIIRGEAIDPEAVPMNEDRIAPFQAFERNPVRLSPTMKVQRERAFQTAVHRVYHQKCSLCELGYRYQGQAIAVEAAHIIPVSDKGTSKDIRNGILLCKNHHSLFDSQLWAFDEDFRVLVTGDRLFRKSAANNCVLKAEGKKLPNLPDKHYDFPAREAISFRLDRFHKTDI